MEQCGIRQRAVYEITDNGRATLGALRLSCWEETIRPFPIPFYLGMTFLDDPASVLPAIERRIESLKAELDEWQVGIAAKSAAGGPARLAMENFGKHLALDLDMLEQLREMLSA